MQSNESPLEATRQRQPANCSVLGNRVMFVVLLRITATSFELVGIVLQVLDRAAAIDCCLRVTRRLKPLSPWRIELTHHVGARMTCVSAAELVGAPLHVTEHFERRDGTNAAHEAQTHSTRLRSLRSVLVPKPRFVRGRCHDAEG